MFGCFGEGIKERGRYAFFGVEGAGKKTLISQLFEEGLIDPVPLSRE